MLFRFFNPLLRTHATPTSHVLFSRPPGVLFAPPKAFSSQIKQEKKSKDTALYLMAVVVGMVGLTYASVPLYRMFCQATGYGGTVREGVSVEDKLKARADNPNPEMEKAAASRELTVAFASNVSDGLPWSFEPTQRDIKVGNEIEIVKCGCGRSDQLGLGIVPGSKWFCLDDVQYDVEYDVEAMMCVR